MAEGGNRISRQLNVSVRGSAPGAAVPPAPWASITGQDAAAAAGQAALVRAADAIAAKLERRSADLAAAAREAAGRQYQARSADGSITVTVDARPRLINVRIAGEATDSAPGELGRALAATVNSALDDARHGTQVLLGGADRAFQAWLSEAAGGPGRSPAAAAGPEAARVTTATSADDSITAAVSGLATVVSIELSREAERGDGQARLGEAVTEAVNAALAAAGQAAQEQLAATPALLADPWSGGQAALDRLASRMDQLLGDLEQIGRDLDD